MAPTLPSSQLFAQVEAEAYHACREWQIGLLLRLRQLEQAIALTHLEPLEPEQGDLIDEDSPDRSPSGDPHLKSTS